MRFHRLLGLVLATAGAIGAPRLSAEMADSTQDGDFFTERAAELGLDYVHFSGMSGEFYFSEIVAPGGALFDYDNDGDLDIFLVQGHMLGQGKSIEDAIGEQPTGELRDRLFRNDLIGADGQRGSLGFTDVTDESGIRGVGYGVGVATGDYDNDGWTDLYVTHYGENRLWRNQGPGADGKITFSDRTEEAGVGESRWSVPATFLDIDRDGWLDLFVGNYVRYTIESHKLCRTLAGAPDYCGPHSYRPEPDRLFRNKGRGSSGTVSFEDLSVRAGLVDDFGGALGAVPADFDGDGWIDFYVANDGMPNQMWMNRHNRTFENDALLAGTSVNMLGRPEASMGVTAGDFDSDGDEDIFLTHLIRETNTLYLNDGGGFFEDTTHEASLATPSWEFTGFGTAWLDYDNDGWLDLLAANGEVKVIPSLEARGDPHPLHQTNQLFRNLGANRQAGQTVRFAEVTADAGPAFRLSEVSRGVAVGDLDNDGDTDVLQLNNNGAVRLLINNVGHHNRWIGFELLTGSAGRNALGAWVEVAIGNGKGSVYRRASSGGSYISASDPRVLIGLADATSVEMVKVRWPDGSEEVWTTPQVGTYTTLRQGSGSAASESN